MKRSPLSRRTPLLRGDSQLRRTGRLNAVSPKRRVREREARETFEDAHGVSFAAARAILGEEIGAWPVIVRGVRNTEVCRMFHALHPWCWVCLDGTPAKKRESEAHHGASGSRGKSDDLCILFALCRSCHENVSQIDEGYLLYLKWHFDRPHTNWMRMAQLWGRHLKELRTENT